MTPPGATPRCAFENLAGVPHNECAVRCGAVFGGGGVLRVPCPSVHGCSLVWLRSTGRELIYNAVYFFYQLLNIYHQAVVIFSHQRFIKLTNTSFFKSLDDLKDDISEHFKVFDVFNR